MIGDARHVVSNSVLETDLCIVGAGAVGITLALAFANTDQRVILVESGGFDIDADTEALNEGSVANPVFGTLEGSRLRYFGGTTNHWGGYSAPLEPADFATRDHVPYSGWPIRYEDLLPYYRAALKVLQLPSWVLDRPPPRHALSHPDVVPKFRFINALRFGQVYRAQLEAAQNIQILLYGNLTGFDHEEESRVSSVTIGTLTGNAFRVKAKQYVLACGTLENTRILLASLDLPLFDVVRQHDWLGRCFMQHPHIDVGQLHYSADYAKAVLYKSNGFEDHLGTSAAYQNERQLLNCTMGLYDYAQTQWDGEKIPQYLQRMMAPSTPFELRAQIRVRCEQSPRRENRVVLTDAKDALGTPRIEVTWQPGDLDLKSIIDAAWLMAAVAGSNNMGIVHLADWVRSKKLPDYVWGGHHHLGTTRMSESPEYGVVDSNCKVHGVENLYLTGGGIFPTSGWANPTFTIVALALRLADHLKPVS